MAHRNVIAVIPARGNSKGILRKNLYPLVNRPMVLYTVEAALAAKHVTKVVVSTEDAEISACVKAAGAKVAVRSRMLSNDNVHALEPTLQAVRGALDDDVVVMLLPTSPLRTSVDIDQALKLFFSTDCDAVVAVTPSAPQARLRYIDSNKLKPVKATSHNLQRQDDEYVYKVNGSIFIAKKKDLVANNHMARVAPYIMPPSRSIDVDDLDDMTMVEALLR
jgi:N-acylneuraminate cytidylyltransferase/CMP-N,N'-diacetyllegionaminic acid synthase